MLSLPEIGSSLPFVIVRSAIGLRPLFVRALAALLLVATLIGCAGDDAAASDLARRVVRLGPSDWTVLSAPEDGMRGRSGFDGADGMLFDFGHEVDPGAVVFVMDGVGFPLDIAWFDASGTLVGHTTMAVCPAVPCPTFAPPTPYRWAIEAPAGALDHLAPSDRLELGA